MCRPAPRCLKAGFGYTQAIRHEVMLSEGSRISHKGGSRVKTDPFAPVSVTLTLLTDPRLSFSMHSQSQIEKKIKNKKGDDRGNCSSSGGVFTQQEN